MKNIAVVFGGISAEHDVSIITGRQAYMALDRFKYNVYPLYLSQDGEMYYVKDYDIKDIVSRRKYPNVTLGVGNGMIYIKKTFGYRPLAHIDVAILCTHGGDGEDGSLQGLLNMCGIKYTSSNVLGSAMTMDKIMTKCVLNEYKIPNVPYVTVYKDENNASIKDKVNGLGYPVIIKPATLGSSIGITKCEKVSDLNKGLSLAFEYDNKVLIEKYIEDCKEVNIAVIGDKSCTLSMTEQPLSSHDILSYDDKYIRRSKSKTSKSTQQRKMPAEITDIQKGIIENIARQVFEVFELRGVIRIDFILDRDGNVYVNEINNIPGSLAYYLFKSSFRKLIDQLIDIAEKSSNIKVVKYKSKILDNYI